jgi:transposase
VRRGPRQSGDQTNLWTTKLVRHWIDPRFGVEDCRAGVRQLWHALGFRLRRLRHRHLNAEAEEQVAFVAELEEWLVAWPEDAALLVVEEATVRRHPTLTAQWGVVDEIPDVPTGDDHATVHVYGAVAPLTGRTHDHLSRELGNEACAPFLQHLRTCEPGKRLLVSHDRGAHHQGVGIEEVVRTAGGRLRLTPQPAYSPELKPQARLWKWLRRVVTHHHWFATLREQIEAMRHCFRSLAGAKHQVVRRCGFKTPESIVASL